MYPQATTARASEGPRLGSLLLALVLLRLTGVAGIMVADLSPIAASGPSPGPLDSII